MRAEGKEVQIISKLKKKHLSLEKLKNYDTRKHKDRNWDFIRKEGNRLDKVDAEKEGADYNKGRL